jgi:cytochrome bd-type quinol oxidase subunit 2
MKWRAVAMALLVVVVVLASMPAGMEAAKDDACKGKKKKECEIPEVPWTMVLPMAAVGLTAGYYLLQRKRDRDHLTSEA